MPKFVTPKPEQAEILRRNGIDPDSVAVDDWGDDWIRVLVYKTRDMITINMGDKAW